MAKTRVMMTKRVLMTHGSQFFSSSLDFITRRYWDYRKSRRPKQAPKRRPGACPVANRRTLLCCPIYSLTNNYHHPLPPPHRGGELTWFPSLVRRGSGGGCCKELRAYGGRGNAAMTTGGTGMGLTKLTFGGRTGAGGPPESSPERIIVNQSYRSNGGAGPACQLRPICVSRQSQMRRGSFTIAT